MKDLYLQSEQKRILGDTVPAVDPVLLQSKLKADGKLDEIGGQAYIVKILGSVPTTANMLYHCDTVKNYSRRRKLLKASLDVQKMFSDNTPTADIQSKFQELALSFDDVSAGQNIRLKDCLLDACASLLNQDDDDCIGTGLKDLDYSLNGGFRPGQLIVIGARPTVGKTAIALNIATHQAYCKKHVVFISLEMPAKEIVKRVIVSEAKVSQYKLKSKNINNDDIGKIEIAQFNLQKLNFTILDYSSLEIIQLRAKIKTLNAQNKIDVLYVDYLQLMTGKAETIRERINDITRGLKILAKEENIPVVVMSQLNRLSEGRSDNRPRLSDLKESGSIEQDSDIVMLLHRPKAYDPASDDNTCELILAKHRNGATGLIPLVYFSECFHFTDCVPEARH